MRKILIYLGTTIISITGVCLAAFYFFGIAAERQFHDMIYAMAVLTKQDIKITTYRRHWFDSDAIVSLTLDPHYIFSWQGKKIELLVDDIAQQSFLRTVIIASHIKHGPLIAMPNGLKLAQALIDAKVILSPQQQTLLQRSATMLPLAKMQALVNIWGDGNAYVSSSKFVYHEPKTKVNMLWQGFAWQLNFSRRLEKLQSHFDFFGYELNTPRLNIKLSNFKLINNLRKVAGQFLPDYKLFVMPFFQCQINKATVAGATNTNNNFVINNLNYQSFLHDEISTGIDNGKLTYKAFLHVDNVAVNGANYRNINFDWQADKLNAKIFANLINEITKVQQTDAFNEIQAAYVFEILLRLLNNDAELYINKLEMITPWGKLNVTADMAFKKRLSHAGWLVSLLANSQVMINVRMAQGLAIYLLQQYYKTQGTVDTATKWQSKAQATLTTLAQDNKLLTDDGFYSFSLDYMNGKLLLNNQPLSWVTEK